METPKHTPGPWMVTEDHCHYSIGYTDKDGDYWAIAWLEQRRANEKDDAEVIAKAYLIPEVIELLKRVDKFILRQKYDERTEQIIDAIYQTLHKLEED